MRTFFLVEFFQHRHAAGLLRVVGLVFDAGDFGAFIGVFLVLLVRDAGRVGFLERAHRVCRLGLRIIDAARRRLASAADRRGRRDDVDGVAGGTDDRVLAEIVELRRASAADALGAEC
jgi:hypothetical protein